RLAVEVTLAVATTRRRLVRTILGAEALHRRPRRNLRAIDREVFVRQKASHLPVVQQLGQKLVRDLRLQQPLAILRKDRWHPYRLVHPAPDQPAVQQIVVELLHQLGLGADRVERLQQESPKQPLGWNRRPPAVSVNLGLTTRRITRSGCLAGTRSSRSTYENRSPLRSSDPRIPASQS